MAVLTNSRTQTEPITKAASITKQHAHAHMLLFMTAVLLLAAILRIYHITQQSIWFDEAFAWNIVIQDDMFPRIKADTHPPLYYVLLRGWVTIAGDSPLSLRYLSALISVGTVALVYRVGVELRLSRWLPVIAALMLALSDAEIFLAQETRNYSLYTFFATMSMWLYLRWLRRRSSGAALLWALSTAGLMYTHYQGAFIPAIQGMHALLFLRGRVRIGAIGALAFAGLLFAPWFVGVTVPQAQNAIDNSLPYAIPTNLDTFLALRDSYLGGIWALLVVLAGVGIYTLAFTRFDFQGYDEQFPESDENLRFVAQRRKLRVFGATFLQKGGKKITHIRWGNAFLVLMWFALPFCVLFFGNLYASLLTERKLLIITPAIALMVAAGLVRLDGFSRGLLVAAILVYGVSSTDYYRGKEPWDEIVAGFADYVAPDDLALVETGVGQYPVKYYMQRLMPEDVYISMWPFLGDFTMAPTTDIPTYYNALLPQLLEETRTAASDGVATAWMVFWQGDVDAIGEREALNFVQLDATGYTRTMTLSTDVDGNAIDVYRYDTILRDDPATVFENGMNLRAADFDADSLRIDLWWQVDAAFDISYTTSGVLLDEDGMLVAQFDSPPFFGERPTETWQPGALIYDPKPLELVDGLDTLPPGTYTAAVGVYTWSSEAGITDIATVDGETRFIIEVVER